LIFNQIRFGLINLIDNLNSSQLDNKEKHSVSKVTLEETVDWLKGKFEEFGNVQFETKIDGQDCILDTNDVNFKYDNGLITIQSKYSIYNKPKSNAEWLDEYDRGTKKELTVQFAVTDIAEISTRKLDSTVNNWQSEDIPFALRLSTFNSKKTIKVTTILVNINDSYEMLKSYYEWPLRDENLRDRMLSAFKKLLLFHKSKNEKF
jgi:hypothetical protein